MKWNLGRGLLAAMILFAPIVGCTPSSRGTFKTDGGGGGGGCPQGCTRCTQQGQCQDCTANQEFCAGGNVVLCNPDGTIGPISKMCDQAHGESCAGASCLSPCDVAASTHSYIGCDYWPTTLLNSELNPYFDFAVAVANPLTVGDVVQSAPATVTVTIGGKMVATKTVAPGAVETIILPWVTALSQPPTCDNTGMCTSPKPASVLAKAGAYHLVSTIPVTVYQFNPLQFAKPATKTCVDPPYKACSKAADCNPGDTCAFDINYGQQVCKNPATCHSFTNDASILLPSTALKNEYVAISRQTFGTAANTDGIPGYVAIVATDDNTNVMVQSTAFTEAGNGAAALSPGGTQSFLLNKGDVLELVSKRRGNACAGMSSDAQGTYCDLGPKYDLTGSHITGDKPIVVFGGHSCSFVPYNKWACDHLEEQITPLDTWGQKIAVTPTKPYTVAKEPNVWRVVSGSDNNMITFEPNSAHAPVTLGVGQYVEFASATAFVASGTGRIAVGQYMVGENYMAASMQEIGDPSLGLGVPVEQWRNSYDFLAPASYTENIVTIIGPAGAAYTLDEQPVNGTTTPIGNGMYAWMYLSLKPGAHHLTSGSAFGITVSGTANYTSYLFVGGQNLNDVPVGWRPPTQ